ncbi:hypothetical protein PR048_023204 [Dryococelus australis]|uniref:Uncharacterized protein n=1 Tax=Dryococelus australis TaxID=614101 RepID=A0ABQ9GTI1_9NEOP|nr:hypothetical protein PR048_023204 [Dryococelus australis]
MMSNTVHESTNLTPWEELTVGGPIVWPPRYPVLKSLDVCLWGHVKTLVYNTPVNTREEKNLRSGFVHHSKLSRTCRPSSMMGFTTCCRACIECGRNDSEQLLYSLPSPSRRGAVGIEDVNFAVGGMGRGQDKADEQLAMQPVLRAAARVRSPVSFIGTSLGLPPPPPFFFPTATVFGRRVFWPPPRTGEVYIVKIKKLWQEKWDKALNYIGKVVYETWSHTLCGDFPEDFSVPQESSSTVKSVKSTCNGDCLVAEPSQSSQVSGISESAIRLVFTGDLLLLYPQGKFGTPSPSMYHLSSIPDNTTLVMRPV